MSGPAFTPVALFYQKEKKEKEEEEEGGGSSGVGSSTCDHKQA